MWGRQKESVARNKYIARMKHLGSKDISVVKSGLSLMPNRSFIGASGDGWIMDLKLHGTSLGVLEIKYPYSIMQRKHYLFHELK